MGMGMLGQCPQPAILGVQRRELQRAASSRNESRSFFSYNEADTGNYLSDFQLRVCSFTAEI